MSTPWEIAKEILSVDICAGMAPHKMKPSQVWEMRPEYQLPDLPQQSPEGPGHDEEEG
jgi:hypothetical protein